MWFELLACVGITLILKYGGIFNIPRSALKKIHPKLKEFLECSMCMGFWVGVLIGTLSAVFCFQYRLLLMPFASSASCWIIDNINELVQEATLYLEKKR